MAKRIRIVHKIDSCYDNPRRSVGFDLVVLIFQELVVFTTYSSLVNNSSVLIIFKNFRTEKHYFKYHSKHLTVRTSDFKINIFIIYYLSPKILIIYL